MPEKDGISRLALKHGMMTGALMITAARLLRELIAIRGPGLWIEGLRDEIIGELKTATMEGVSIAIEPDLYEAAFAAVDLVFVGEGKCDPIVVNRDPERP